MRTRSADAGIRICAAAERIVLPVVRPCALHLPLDFRGGHTELFAEHAQGFADACRVVTAADATALFGVDAGNPHFVLGTCVYDDGTNELIVAVFRQQARAMFESSRSSDAQDIANVGDSAYYQDGRLRILKGTNMVELTVTPIPPNWPSPKMLTLANTALSRL